MNSIQANCPNQHRPNMWLILTSLSSDFSNSVFTLVGLISKLPSSIFLSSAEDMLIDFRERKRNIDVREKHWFGYLLYVPLQGPNPQPRHVSWPGIKPQSFSWRDDSLITWATPARALLPCFTGHGRELIETLTTAFGTHVTQAPYRMRNIKYWTSPKKHLWFVNSETLPSNGMKSYRWNSSFLN